MKDSILRLLHWYRDALAAAVLLLIFAFFLSSSRHIQVMIASSVDAKFFPIVICTFGIILCAVNVAAGVVRGNKLRRKEIEEAIGPNVSSEEKSAAIKSVVSIVSIIVYLVLIEPLGFVIVSALYLFVQIMLLSERGKRNPILYVVIAVVVSAACYLFFRNVFYLMLPSGLLPL